MHESALDSLLDELVLLACRLCGAASGALILLDDSGARVRAGVGLNFSAALYGDAFARRLIEASARSRVVEDLAIDPRFRFCAGAVLDNAQGDAYGVLCVMDEHPRDLDALQRQALLALARQAGALLTLDHANRQLREGLLQSSQHQQQMREYQRLLELRNEQLSMQIRLDVLTGLPNRKAFASALEAAVQDAHAQSQPLAMAVADIDRFKAINDTHGHPVGDRVLVQVAQILQATVDGQVLAARQGGEEFVLLMPMHTVAEAERRCEGIQARLRESGLDLPVTLSIGVAAWRHGESAEQLYVRADAALYLAKRSGRDRVVSAA